MACVLVVDDEAGIRNTLAEFLGSDGHDVLLAANVEESKLILAEHSVDVIVLDLLLPRESGLVLLEYVHEAAPEVETVVMSGEPTFESTVKAMRLGAFDYLAKPVLGNYMCEVVAQAARRKAARDQTTRALLESKARFRRLAENAQDMIWRANLTGEMVYVNQAVTKVLDRTPESMLGEPFEGYLQREAVAKIADWIDAVRRGVADDSFNEEVGYLHRSGVTVPCEMSAIAVRDDDGELVALEGITRDITSWKRTEDALRRSEQLRSMALNNAADNIFVASENGEVSYINESARRHYGIEEIDGFTELDDISLRFWFFWCGDDIDAVKEAFDKAVHQKTPVSLDCECGGSYFDVVIAPVSQSDRVESVVCVARDITERKLAERALKESERRYRSLAEKLKESEELFRHVVEAFPQGIIMCQVLEDGRIILSGANSSAQKTLGLESGFAVGQPLEDIVPGFVTEDLALLVRGAALKGEGWERTITWRDADQIRGIFEARGFQTGSGKMALQLLDITDSRRSGVETLGKREKDGALEGPDEGDSGPSALGSD